MNSSQILNPKRPGSTQTLPKPPIKPQSLEKVHLWLIILGALLVMNMMACTVLFLRGNISEASAPPTPTTFTAWDKEELLGKMKALEGELAKAKAEINRQRALIAQMQFISESLQIAVTRIPPPNDPPHGPPPAQPAEAKLPLPVQR